MSTLYVNGTIHSTSDPYATALLVDAGTVAWVGADDTAESMRARSGAEWETVDLDGALVVPAFVDSLDLGGADAEGTRDDGAAARAGVFLSVRPDHSVRPDQPSGLTGDRTIGYRALTAAEADGTAEELAALLTAPSSAGLLAVVGPEGLDDDAVAQLVDRATAAGVQLYLVPRRDQDLAAVLAALRATAAAQGVPALGMARHRLAWGGPVGEADRGTLAELSLSFTALLGADGALTAPVGALLNQAVPVCLGSADGPVDPWAAVRACLEHPDPEQRISARSAFTAATRAGLRALPFSVGAAHQSAGRIAPSAPATFGIWEAESLSVQAPDGRVAAWSTDTRAGTPLLPVLEEGTAAPRCLATLVDGVEVFRAAARG